MDDDGRLRVIAEFLDFDDLATRAFSAVARYGSKDSDVVEGMLAGLDRVVKAARPPDREGLLDLREVLRRQADGVDFPVKSRRAAMPTTGACKSTDSSTTT